MERTRISKLAPNPCANLGRRGLDWIWLLVLAIGLGFTFFQVRPGRYCAYIGTDFRGYYAAAQIAWQSGFTQVFDPTRQEAAQAGLAYQCPDGSTALPLVDVYVPYLPVFILLFTPLLPIHFTASYYAWSVLNLAALGLYIVRFSRALGERPGLRCGLQWMICLPTLANLALGQVNVFLVLCLGEFILAVLRDRERRAGLWLAALLIKPYTLILLLPGLLLGRRWRVLGGFGIGMLAVFAGSLALAGWQGVVASLDLAAQFTGALIKIGPSMINWRTLALNLAGYLPGWMAWGIAIVGMVAVCSGVLALWAQPDDRSHTRFMLLVLATCAGTFTVSWHSHFYLLMLLIPVLVVLDTQNRVPLELLAAWIFAPWLVYLASLLVLPSLARNLVGLSFLALNLVLLLWSGRLLWQHRGVPTVTADSRRQTAESF